MDKKLEQELIIIAKQFLNGIENNKYSIRKYVELEETQITLFNHETEIMYSVTFFKNNKITVSKY